MVELKTDSVNVKKENEKNSEHKPALEKDSQKNGLKEDDLPEDVLQEDISQVETLLNDDIGEEDFRAKVEKITDKETLIKMINGVVDLHIKRNKDPHIDYKFKILNDHFIGLFGSDECDRCFEDTIEKIKHYNSLKDVADNHSFDDDTINKSKKKNKWWKIGKNKKSKKKKNKNKGSKSTNSGFVSYGGQKKKIDKVKKAQAKGKGNWRLIAKHSVSIGGTALLCGILSLIVPPVGSLLAAVTAGTASVLIYRDVKNKSKHRKKISNKVGGAIDKLEDTHSKSNIKRMENELSKFKKEEEQLSLTDKSVEKRDRIGEVKNQQDRVKQEQTKQEQVIQDQIERNPMMQNPMMQNPMMQQYTQNPMMQNPMMQNPMMQNPMMQQYMQNPVMQNPMMQQYMQNQAMQQCMQNPMMQNPIMNQFLQFQQIETQNQQATQQVQQPVVQQNVNQQQSPQTHQQKLQQQNTNNGVGISM